MKPIPSMLARLPAGSSKLHPLRLAASKEAHNMRTPINWAPSILHFDRSARSRLHQLKLAPFRLQPDNKAY